MWYLVCNNETRHNFLLDVSLFSHIDIHFSFCKGWFYWLIESHQGDISITSSHPDSIIRMHTTDISHTRQEEAKHIANMTNKMTTREDRSTYISSTYGVHSFCPIDVCLHAHQIHEPTHEVFGMHDAHIYMDPLCTQAVRLPCKFIFHTWYQPWAVARVEWTTSSPLSESSSVGSRRCSLRQSF